MNFLVQAQSGGLPHEGAGKQGKATCWLGDHGKSPPYPGSLRMLKKFAQKNCVCVHFLGEDAPRVSSRWQISFLTVKNVVKFSVTDLKLFLLGENSQKICHQKPTTFFTPQNSQNFITLNFWDRSCPTFLPHIPYLVLTTRMPPLKIPLLEGKSFMRLVCGGHFLSVFGSRSNWLAWPVVV